MDDCKTRKSACYCSGLRRAAGAATAVYNERLASAGLSVTQFQLMRYLDRLGSASVTELSQAVGLDRTTLARTLKPLSAMGVIEDGAEKGRRNRELRLTESGRRALESGERLWDSAQRDIERRLGVMNARELLRLLNTLVAG